MPSVTGDWDNIPEDSPSQDDGDLEVKIHGLMPRENRPYGFPVSRDWADVDCKANGCRWNRAEKCMVPSRCQIGADGRCSGFEVPPQQIGKLDGD